MVNLLDRSYFHALADQVDSDKPVDTEEVVSALRTAGGFVELYADDLSLRDKVALAVFPHVVRNTSGACISHGEEADRDAAQAAFVLADAFVEERAKQARGD